MPSLTRPKSIKNIAKKDLNFLQNAIDKSGMKRNFIIEAFGIKTTTGLYHKLTKPNATSVEDLYIYSRLLNISVSELIDKVLADCDLSEVDARFTKKENEILNN